MPEVTWTLSSYGMLNVAIAPSTLLLMTPATQPTLTAICKTPYYCCVHAFHDHTVRS